MDLAGRPRHSVPKDRVVGKSVIGSAVEATPEPPDRLRPVRVLGQEEAKIGMTSRHVWIARMNDQ